MKYCKKILLLSLLAAFAVSYAAAQRKSRTRSSTRQQAIAPKTIAGNKTHSNTAAAQSTGEGRGDTSSPRVVTITSAFKPSLKNAAKVNFTAASPLIDSSRTPVLYSVPSQNLLFSYQPVPIKPLALAVDTGFTWVNDNFIKAGIGNFSTVMSEAAFSFGDGVKNTTTLHAGYLSTKGDRPAQQYAHFGMDVITLFNTNHHNEWTTKAWYRNTTRYYYGYEPATLPYTKGDILRRFNDGGIELGLRNKMPNAFNISYAPKVRLSYFADNSQAKEYQVMAQAPLRKTFGKLYALDIGITADISKTTIPLIPNNRQLKNDLYYVSPSVQFNTPNVKLNVGIRPSWDNGSYATLPNVTVEAKIGEAGVILEAGWVGAFEKNNYRSLSAFNPWVSHPSTLQNTKLGEQYAGIKGSAGNHFTYHTRLSFQRLNNQPLFPNSQGDGKSFTVLYEPEMKVVKLHGELGYTVQEKLSILAAATYRRFTSLALYEKAWGLLPLEINGAIKWKVLKDLQLKTDVFMWDGSRYRNRNLQTYKLDPAADINIGAEFTVMPKLNLWLQLNNILNNKYQRWNQYQVMGLNVLSGVVYSFR